MSRLDELIEELCPDGVEYRKVGDIANISRGKVMSKDFLKENAGEYPVYSSQTENEGKLGSITTYMFDGEYLTWTTDGANAGTVFYRSGKFSVTNVCGVIDNVSEDVNTKYLYYVLNRVAPTYVNSGMGNPKLMSNVMARISLPVPPEEVQREIVHILDSFTLLTAELTAELTARKKQYNFYRDTLIQKECRSEKVKLNTICEIYDGTHQTPKYTNNGIPFVSVENIDDLYGTQKFISSEAYAKYKIKPRIGDVFMTRITAGIIGKCTVVDRDDDLAYYVSLALLRPNADVLDSKYLKYYLESGRGRRELSKWILWDATPTKINKDDIGRVLISVPPLDTQKRLVQVIEHFDAICTDLNIGLPAEIEARQKQYEYYRDLLLTFAETGSMPVSYTHLTLPTTSRV